MTEKVKKVKRGVGQPRKYRKTKCPNCNSHWHTGNGQGREKCNDCGCTWAKRTGEDELLASQTPAISTDKEAVSVNISNKGIAA